jgi:hypothetical protein
MLENSEAQAKRAGENDIGAGCIGNAHGHYPRQPAVRRLEHHEDDQPNTESAKSGDQQTLQQAYEQSHDVFARRKVSLTINRQDVR